MISISTFLSRKSIDLFFSIYLAGWQGIKLYSSILLYDSLYFFFLQFDIALFFTINHHRNFCRRSKNGVLFLLVNKLLISLRNFVKIITCIISSDCWNELRRKFRLDLRTKCLNEYLYEIVNKYFKDCQSPAEVRDCLSVFFWKFCEFSS